MNPKTVLHHITTAALSASVGILYAMHCLHGCPHPDTLNSLSTQLARTEQALTQAHTELAQTHAELIQTRKAMARYRFTIFTGDLPASVQTLAIAEAHKQGIDPALVLSVIQQESDGDPQARSRAGAVGLMQLMPNTAKELKVTNPRCPKQNVSGGVRYLRTLLNRYNNVTLALYAYNWGMGNVDHWLKSGTGSKGQPMPEETRKYAPSILARIQHVNI